MKALISDIHGNLDALKVVMADIEGHSVDEVCFLGDVVGYGPEPEACIDIVEKAAAVHLLGNHDFAMLNAPIGFNPIAAGAINCQRARMEPGIYSMPWKHRRWQFLGDLKQRHMEDGALYVHASPRDPVMEYVLPTDPQYDPDKCADIFTRVERIAFCGHTHVPGVLIENPAWVPITEFDDFVFELTEGKFVVNIGSVGQPRDRDPRASYVLFDGEKVTWRRLEYDFNATIEKIRKLGCIDERAGTRLAQGK